MQRINSNYIAVLLLSAMAFIMISSLVFMSSTYDESAHLNYGLSILNCNSSRVKVIEYSKMPFSVFNAALYRLAKIFFNCFGILLDEEMQNQIFLLAGRLATVMSSLLLGVYVFKWSRNLYGNTAAIFSLFLYVFSPNVIAHSRLITTDLYAALMVTVSVFYFWRFIQSGGWNNALLSAFTLGLSQLAKYTCALLYPIFLAIVLIRYSGLIVRLVIRKDIGELLRCFKCFFKYVLLFSVVSVALINLGFLYNGSFTPLSKYEFESDAFKKIQQIPILKNVPLPLPYPYLKGIDGEKYHENTGLTFGNIYLLGKLRETHGKHFDGFKGYYFFAFLFKEPLAIQLFILLSLTAAVLNRNKRKFIDDELPILLPAFIFITYFSCFFKDQIGIRHLLIIFPLLYVFCGSFFKDWRVFSFKLKSSCLFLCIYLACSSLSYFPHYISYFNEIAWDRKEAYKLLADSNIDWGQTELYLKEYVKKNPETKVNPELPSSGKIVVSVNELVGVYYPDKYKWLRENFEPVDSIGYSYLIYDVSAEALKKTEKK